MLIIEPLFHYCLLSLFNTYTSILMCLREDDNCLGYEMTQGLSNPCQALNGVLFLIYSG